MPTPEHHLWAIKTAAELYDMRNIAKKLFGARFAEHTPKVIATIKNYARDKGIGDLEAVMHLSDQLPPSDRFIVMAAYAEMVEPDGATPALVQTLVSERFLQFPHPTR